MLQCWAGNSEKEECSESPWSTSARYDFSQPTISEQKCVRIHKQLSLYPIKRMISSVSDFPESIREEVSDCVYLKNSPHIATFAA